MKNCSGSEDGGSKQGQRDLLEGLLARQLSRISSPGRWGLSRSHRAALKCCDGLYWQIEVPAKMTHTKMALVRRG